MNSRIPRFPALLASLVLATSIARSGPALVGEELAVIQSVAAIMSHDSARPLDFLYFESEFPAHPFVSSSMSNPDRTAFCGLTRDQGQALVRQLTDVTAEPIEFDKAVAKAAGLSLGHKKLERFRYLTLSRVVFSPDGQRAWLAVDLNGESGAVFRMDKVGNEWSKAARCAGWVKTQ
jgi:hypothetical protein